MRRTHALTLFALILVAANAFALGEARIQGKVIDSVTKKPIVGATIKIEATSGHTVKQEYKTDKNGEYRFLVLDATLNYDFTWSADGYQSFQTNMKLKLGDINTRDVELTPASAVAKTAATTAAPDPAIVAYNEGAALANDGKNVEAIAKMEEAASKKADFSAAYQALAHLYFRQKGYAKSVEYANKAIGVTGDDQDMFAVLADDYTALNQKDKAAEYRKKLPADANALFNEAASLINAGKDNQAEPLLKQAVAANDKMAIAYYELGMLYVRASKNADAKENLTKFIELAGPVGSATEIQTRCKSEGDATTCVSRLKKLGEDVNTAKEMLKYVK